MLLFDPMHNEGTRRSVSAAWLALLLVGTTAHAQPEVNVPPLRYGVGSGNTPTVSTPTLRYGVGSDDIPTVSVPTLRYGVGNDEVPVVSVPTLRYGVGSGNVPTVTVPALRYGVSADTKPTVRVPTLRYGVSAEKTPTIKVPTLRYGVAADSVPEIRVPTLRYGVQTENVPLVDVPVLRYGVPESGTDRKVRFELLQVTPLRADNAIDPFDYRDVISTIDAVTAPVPPPEPGPEPGPDPDPEPQPEPAPNPVMLTFTGVPIGQVFSASLNFMPSTDPQQWSVAEGPNNSTRMDAAFGFWGGFAAGGYELQFQAGMGWSSPDLPKTLVLASENFGFETRTVTFELTRQSDGRRFSVTADVSAGSDGDISVSSARGWDCFTNTGSCP